MTVSDDLASLEAGLDALETHKLQKTSRIAQTWSAIWPPLLFVVLLVVVWQLLYNTHHWKPYKFPSPGSVVDRFQEEWDSGDLQEAVWNSVRRGGLGFLASLAIGTPLGLLVGRVKMVRRAVGPILSGLQSLPSVAWVPAAILWFGIGDATIYFVVLFGAVPSIANGMVSGLDQVPPLFLRVGRVLGARGFASARHVLLPAALPGYVGGLRQGWAFSWRSLMAAELIARSPELGLGIGQLLDLSRQNTDVPGVIAAIFTILVIGIAIELCLFAPIERRVLRRRGLLSATV
ncbi:MAG: putative transport system integral rane protein [Frankiales bacterium]|nr:putative transport system integral rane protein [Frankiales bacterium]